MKAAIYCRVSTQDQQDQGTSLDSQLEACKKLAQEKGYNISEEFIVMETYSGLAIDRHRLNEVRQWVRDKQIDVIIAYTLDRLSRDPVHIVILQEEMEKSGVELVLVTETVDSSDLGKLITYIKGYAAKLEAEKIRERTIRGKMARAKSGKLLGGKGCNLYGYDYLPGRGVGEGKRYINEEEAAWVREIYRWLVEEGLTINGIIYRLRSLGVPTPSGRGFWGKSTVHKILKNTAYIGKTYGFTQSRIEATRHNKAMRKNKATHIVFKSADQWVEIPDATPPIINEELFNQAQAKLRKNSELASRNTKLQYLLSGYVFCQECGRRYSGWTSRYMTKNGIKVHRWYRCPKNDNIVTPTPCRNLKRDANHLEKIVWEEIEKLLSNPQIVLVELEVKRKEASRANVYQAELERLYIKLRHAEREKDRVWRAFELTGDEDRFTLEIKNIMEKIDILGKQRLGLEKRIELSQQAELDIDRIQKFCELASRNLSEFTFQDKRLTLEALSIKVWIDNDNVTLEGAIPEADINIVSTKLWHSK